MRQLQTLALLLLAVAIVYAGFQFTNGFGLRRDDAPKYVISDIYSLVTILNDNGECQAAVGYHEKFVIGTFVAIPVKKMICNEYYFQERPSARYRDAKIVLVQLNTGEYHWILENLLVIPLRK